MTVLSGTAFPSYGAFLGTSASSELLTQISEAQGSTFFGSTYADTTAAFMRDVITPIRMVAQQVTTTAQILMDPDVIRPLLKPEDFAHIPSEMQLPILLYAPVRDLFDRGRIEGFGYTSDYLPEEDVYANILASGRVEDVLSAMDKNGMVNFQWRMCSDDPHLDEHQVRAIRDTRETIDRMIAETDFDPTCWPLGRG